MSEAKYDGTWHWVDCFTKFYCWRREPGAPNGRTIACHTDIKNDPGLVTDLLVLDPKEKIVYDKRNRKEMIGDRLCDPVQWLAARPGAGQEKSDGMHFISKRRDYSGFCRLRPDDRDRSNHAPRWTNDRECAGRGRSGRPIFAGGKAPRGCLRLRVAAADNAADR
jgi:hypothetical protein